MRSWMAAGWFLLVSCGNNNAEPAQPLPTTSSTNTTATTIGDTDTQASFASDTDATPAITPLIKQPSGIYQFMLPYGNLTILHTVAFFNGTYRLQEEYLEKDSTVIDEGTWAPSQGFIWLYKDQLVRGRYRWKGDTLQYLSPRLERLFSMAKQTPAGNGAVWQEKAAGGATFYGIGTEPFWSVEMDKNDSITISMPHWTAPLKVKVSDRLQTEDSTIYSAPSDSLRVVTYPYFCSDGMSDFTYTTRVKFVYKGQAYDGCGIVLTRNR